MSALSGKALLVNADGTTETIPASEAVGLYHIRYTRCGECKRPHDGARKYKVCWASNSHTRRPGDPRDPSANEGTFVLIEEPA